jgi:hypothetical protein
MEQIDDQKRVVVAVACVAVLIFSIFGIDLRLYSGAELQETS